MSVYKSLCTAAVAALLIGSACNTAEAKRVSSGSGSGEENAVLSQLASLNKMIAAGDSKGMALLWSTDGRFTDDLGTAYNGREAVEANFEKSFKETGKPPVELVIETIKFHAPGVAVVEGTVNHKASKNKISRYSMTMSKKSKEWKIASATETPIIAGVAAPENPLESFDWLIGDWEVEKGTNKVNMKAHWAPSKKFIFCEYDIRDGSNPARRETQVIGWDPRNGIPISWNFDSNGGYGQGRWSRKSNQWVVQANGMDRSGSTTDATNIYTRADKNTFVWQSVNRHINGLPVGDTQPLNVKRVSN